MKMNDKILKYIDNQMSSSERSDFENELKNSSELQKELKKYKSLMHEVDQLKNIDVNESYFAETIPKFRSRQEVLRRFLLFPRLTFSIATVAAVALIFVISISKTNKNIIIQKNNIVAADTSGSEISSLLDPSSDQLNIGYISKEEESSYDSLMNSVMTKELNLSPNDLSYLSPDQNTDLSSMLQNVNEKEAENIYKEVLNRRFFER